MKLIKSKMRTRLTHSNQKNYLLHSVKKCNSIKSGEIKTSAEVSLKSKCEVCLLFYQIFRLHLTLLPEKN